ncbi:nitroreductase/quinone reductase family protein [Mycolicibacterium thermoresistibile]
MAYLKPPWFTKAVFNRIAMALGVGGSQTLTVTRRVSRQPQRIPVIPVDVDNNRYLVSTRGETEWVRNVRADANVTLGNARYVAREIPAQDREPILTAYRKKAGRVVKGYFAELPQDADHPVFLLTPVSGP